MSEEKNISWEDETIFWFFNGVISFIVALIQVLFSGSEKVFAEVVFLGFLLYIPVGIVNILILWVISFVYDTCHRYRCTTDKTYYENGKLKSETPHSMGQIHGVQKYYYQNGQLSSETPHSMGQIHGVQKCYYQNGLLSSETPYIQGKKNGVGKCYYQNGNISQIITFKHNRIYGNCKIYNPDGKLIYNDIVFFIMHSDTVYCTYYDNGNVKIVNSGTRVAIFNPDGTLVQKYKYRSGYPHVENYDNGRVKSITINKDGHYVIATKYYENGELMFEYNFYTDKHLKVYNPGGKLIYDKKYSDLSDLDIKFDERITSINTGVDFMEYYENGQLKIECHYCGRTLNGVVKSYYEDGKLERETPYEYGKKHGVEKSYYEDGKLAYEWPFEYGKKHGVVKSYYEDGKLLRETPYENDEEHGVEKWYNKNGKLECEIPYENGEEHGVKKRYYEDGKLERETPYEYGKKHGVEKCYYEDGKLAYEGPYEYGKKHGVEKSYYKNGKLAERPFENGKKNGVEKWYNENGNIIAHQNYVKGYKANDDGVLYESEYHRMLIDQNEELREQLKKTSG